MGPPPEVFLFLHEKLKAYKYMLFALMPPTTSYLDLSKVQELAKKNLEKIITHFFNFLQFAFKFQNF